MDAFLGLLLLAVYVVGMVALAAAVTFVAIKIFPTKDRATKKPDAPPPSDDGASGGSGGSGGTPAGRLFRKAKRGEA